MNLCTLITWEHENSEPVSRVVNMEFAFLQGINGGYYKAQIVNELGVVDYEWKA